MVSCVNINYGSLFLYYVWYRMACVLGQHFMIRSWRTCVEDQSQHVGMNPQVQVRRQRFTERNTITGTWKDGFEVDRFHSRLDAWKTCARRRKKWWGIFKSFWGSHPIWINNNPKIIMKSFVLHVSKNNQNEFLPVIITIFQDFFIKRWISRESKRLMPIWSLDRYRKSVYFGKNLKIE